MTDEVTGIAGIPRRLVKARRRLSADRVGDKPVTQRQIAEAVGVTEGQVGHWEKGRQMPDLPMIERLAAALEVRAEWLAYGVEPMARGSDCEAPIATNVPTNPVAIAAIVSARAAAAAPTPDAAPEPKRQASGGPRRRARPPTDK
jgi:transcriptional regulator with XRE-family HTH domain